MDEKKELEELIAQRKEISKRIRELRNPIRSFGRVRIDFERYPTHIPDRWYLAIQCAGERSGKSTKSFKSVYNSSNREDVVNSIPDLIADLQALYDSEKGGNE